MRIMATNAGETRKKGTNLSLRVDLVAEARALGVSLSQACEQGLANAVKLEKQRRWLEQNEAAIQSNWDFVDKHGMPLERFRRY